MSDFRVSSFCGNGGCVEVNITPGNVQVRGTGQDDALDFTHAEWQAFTAGVRAGEFDLPQAPGDADVDITDRLECRAVDGSRLVFTRDEHGRVVLSVGQCPDRSVSVRLPGAEWERIRAWGGGDELRFRADAAEASLDYVCDQLISLLEGEGEDVGDATVGSMLDKLPALLDRLRAAPAVPAAPDLLGALHASIRAAHTRTEN